MKTEIALIIGRGGREHALAWKLAQSPRVAQVWVAPGNGGTALAGGKVANVDLQEGDFAGLIEFARRSGVTLTIVGPEAPLADGIVDTFQAAGLRCFGPSKTAAQIEASKAFAKDFMARHGIPTARHATFTDFDRALDHLHQVDYPVVLKASGLAAGKGVILPASLAETEAALGQIMVDREFGAAGDAVVIEERLVGPEASVLAWSDGKAVALMPAAQDHKRVFDGDQGPNTGGMGAYAPAPLMTPALLDKVRRTVLQPAIDGLAAEGMPYIGVLYAGMMLTADGPRTLEFNCWRDGAAATVVAASEGYPGSYPKGREISGVAEAEVLPGVAVFHAGTRLDDTGRLLSDGGRVLAVTGVGDDLPAALSRAYSGIERIHFEGMHYRRDIGAKANVG